MSSGFIVSAASIVGAALLPAFLLTPAANAAPNTWQMAPAQIIDQTGFEQPMVAATIMVPAGMNTTGGVRWRNQPNDCPQGHTFDWQAASPDKLWTISIIPSERWGASSTGQPAGVVCNVIEVRSAKGFLQEWVKYYRSGARILDYRDRPDLEQSTAQLNHQTNLSGMRSSTRTDAGEVLIAYNLNGQELREAIAAVVVITESAFSGMGVGPDMTFLQGFNLPAFAMRAPAGSLNFAMMEKIRQSIKLAPEWSARINQHNQVMSRQNLDHSKKMHDIRMGHQRDMSAILTKGHNDRSAAMDRSHREFIESIRGTETWNLPGGGTTELADSNDAWQLDNGTIVTTDRPGWQPSDAGLSGTQLQRTR